MSSGTGTRWSLTRPAFDRLLQRFSPEPDRAAQEYDILREKLMAFFSRRSVGLADVLTDETIDRVARRLDEGHVIQHVDAYFYGVAHRVILEWRRRRLQERAAERAAARSEPATVPELREARAACLERCLKRLPRHSRGLIMGYHGASADERQRLAESLGITYPSLRARASRLRVRLEECLQECLRNRRAGQP